MGGDRMRMMKRISIALVLLLLLIGCESHTHAFEPATCTQPSVCAECGKTQGEPLGHDYQEATCTEPSICTRCGQAQGEPLGHDFSEATCIEPSICTRCGQTQDEPLGHDFSEATCTEPSICLRCGQTQGDPLGHDYPSASCTEPETCLRCGQTAEAPGHDWREAGCTAPRLCRVCGQTEGEPLGHDMENGVCTRCGFTVFAPFTGSGDDVIFGVSTGGGIYRVHLVHPNDRDFTVWAYDANGKADLLVCARGAYDGSVLLFGEAPFTFEVFSVGAWRITVEQLDETAADAFSGKGDAVTDLCLLKSGTYRLTHTGEDDFAVWLYTTDGETLALHTPGACRTETQLTVPDGSLAFFAVRADGAWRIERVDPE